MVSYKNMLDLFEQTVEAFPEKTAIRHNDKDITFYELQRISKSLAQCIRRSKGDLPRPVAIFLPKGIDIVVADIAVTYSGNFFSNLDIKTPVERLRNLIASMQPAYIITNSSYMQILLKLDYTGGAIIDIDQRAVGCSGNEETCYIENIDSIPFCIINTSGSTGTPKSVVLSHLGFLDYTLWAIRTFHFSERETLGVMSAVVFDHYVYEICLMMATGATLVMLDMTLASFPAKLLKEVQEKKVNYIFWVPTVMVNIANMGLLDKFDLSGLRMIWFAGEVFPTKQFNIWKKCLPQATFVNLYGPCEITVDCTYYVAQNEISEDQSIPIGVPRDNVDVFLLDGEDNLCNNGEIGEICVRGNVLAMGYYNNPEKTAEVFVQNPLNKSYPEKMYRTGDLAYIDDSGVFVFKGRKDSLIKHMGNRVELGEIEHIIINKLKLVRNCCAVYDYTKKEIVLIYEGGEEDTEMSIRKAVIKEFPRYMLPARYVCLEELPRNTNGKIDRNSLKKMINEIEMN